MHSDEYRRLHAACVAMAEQSDLPDAKVRWLALAQACFSLAKDVPDGSRECAKYRVRTTGSSARGTSILRAA
jgi:hypothetical protein